MEFATCLRSRLVSKSYFFLQKKLFIDCILKSNENEFHAHKLILSKESKWFNNYFMNHPTLDSVQIIELPFCSGNSFLDVIKLLYSVPIDITISKAILLLKYGNIYGIPKLLMIANSFLNEVVNEDNVFKVTREMILNDITEEAFKYVDLLSRLFFKAKPVQRKNMYASLSPKVLAKILQSQEFNNVSDKEKVEIIEDFIGDKVINENEKKDLESVINWNDPNAYLYFTNFKCSWVTNLTARPLLIKTLDIRRDNIINFSNESKSASEKVSRWYPFIWAHHIAQTIYCKESPAVKIVHLANTLGILTKSSTNPGKYGLLNIDSSPPLLPIEKFLARNGVLEDDKIYFLSKDLSYENETPFYSIKFSPNAHFLLSNILIDSYLPRFHNQSQRNAPQSVMLEGESSKNGKSECITLDPQLQFSKGIAKKTFNSSTPVSSIKFSLKQPSKDECILRVKYVDLVGKFLP